MIGTVEVRVSAGRPNMPVRTIAVVKGSAATIGVLDVPKVRCGATVSSVTVSIENAAGTVKTVAATLKGGVWCATIPASHFAAPGTVDCGLTITAGGIAEDGSTATSWIIGKGNVEILSADGVPVPGESWQNVHYRATVPTTPKVGDLAKVSGVWKIYTATGWQAFGTTDYSDLSNKPSIGGVELTGNKTLSDLGAVGTTDSRLTDARTPTAHASSHATGGADALSPADIGAAAASHTHTKSDVTDFGGPYLPTSGGDIDGDLKIIGDIEFIAGSMTGDSFTINGEQVATENQIPSQTSDLTNDSGFMTSNDVVPQGTGTEVIATIGGKEIKAPAGGGGGGGKCLLFLSHSGNSSQYVQFTSGGHVYKIGKSFGFLTLYIDGVKKGMPCSGLNNIMIPVEGSVFVYDDGYAGDCFVFLDEQKVGSTLVYHDTTGKQSMTVSFGECLEQGTLILMADGTQKTVCELVDGDKVACINPYTGELDEDEATSCDGGFMKFHNKTDKWIFADGTILKTVHPHQFFNVRTGKMEYIADFQIGDEVRKNDGTTTALVSHEVINGIVFHNTLYTKNYNNYFANGILTGNRKSVKWGWYWMEQNEATYG